MTSPTTQLHPQLAADTIGIADNDFVWVRYLNDQRFPWLVVIPKRDNLREWFQLSRDEQHQLLTIVNELGAALQTITSADKINLGALGNMVPQLHLHIIARFEKDSCWPGAVWGQGQAQPYQANQSPSWLAALLPTIQSLLN